MSARLAMLLADVPMALQSQLLRQMVALHSRLPAESAHGADQARISKLLSEVVSNLRFLADDGEGLTKVRIRVRVRVRVRP